jgi:hypothetical protein
MKMSVVCTIANKVLCQLLTVLRVKVSWVQFLDMFAVVCVVLLFGKGCVWFEEVVLKRNCVSKV